MQVERSGFLIDDLQRHSRDVRWITTGQTEMARNLITAPSEHIGLRRTQSGIPTADARLSEGRQRLPGNVLANLTWLALNMCVNLWYTPYLIDSLGVAVYGLVPLADSVTGYLAVLTQGLNSAVSRFLVIDLAKGDVDGANRTFNTAVVSGLAIAAALLPIALVLSWFTPEIFDIPVGTEYDARWLVLFTLLAFMAATFASSFAVPSYAYHRFDLRVLVKILSRFVVRVGGTVILFTLLSPQLWQVGFVIFVSTLFSCLGYAVTCHKLAPELEVKLRWFDSSLLKGLLEFSGWVLVNQVGALLFLNIDLIVVNLVFGAEVAGRYGAVLVFPRVIRTLASTVTEVLKPIIFMVYARGNLSRLVRLSCLAVKFTGLAMALPVGLLCGLGRPLLEIWLGPEFADLSWLLGVLVGHLCISVAVGPLFSLQAATNNVRVPGIVSLVMGVVNTVLAVVLALWSGWGYISVAVAGAVVLIAKNLVFTPIYGARILKLPWWTFLPSMVAGAVACLAVGVGTYLISLNYAVTNWGQLALIAAMTSGVYIVAAYFGGLGAGERDMAKSELQRRFGRL